MHLSQQLRADWLCLCLARCAQHSPDVQVSWVWLHFVVTKEEQEKNQHILKEEKKSIWKKGILNNFLKKDDQFVLQFFWNNYLK